MRTAVVLLCASLALTGQARRALVIGNGDYKNIPAAAQATASARAMARALTATQFQVAPAVNVEAESLGREISKFLQQLQPNDVAVFYFAGYAVQDMGENYLLPVGYAPASTDGIEYQSYSLKRLIRYLETKKLATGIVIVEPAPGNAVLEKKFPEPGLASMDIRAANLVLAMANLPGRAVPAAAGREIGRFTEAWVNAASEPGVQLDAALRRIKQQLSQATGGEQVPAEISTLVNEFAFQPRSAAAMEWDRVAGSKDPATFEAFRQKFAGDPLAIEAARRVEQLEWERVKGAPDARGVRQFLTRFPQHPEALNWLKAHEASEKVGVNTAILDVIARYAKAYENKDVEAMQAARPGFGAADKKRLEQAFREFKSIRYSLVPTGDPAVEPTAATVKCRLKVEMKSNDGGNPRPVDQAVIVKLRRQADAWVIDTIQ